MHDRPGTHPTCPEDKNVSDRQRYPLSMRSSPHSACLHCYTLGAFWKNRRTVGRGSVGGIGVHTRTLERLSTFDCDGRSVASRSQAGPVNKDLTDLPPLQHEGGTEHTHTHKHARTLTRLMAGGKNKLKCASCADVPSQPKPKQEYAASPTIPTKAEIEDAAKQALQTNEQ